MTHKYRKKFKNVCVLKCWMFSIWADSFFCSLCVLYGVICNFRSNKYKSFTAVKFFQFLVIKTLDSELDPDSYPYPDPQLGKVLDPDLH
jgi:hypothetical protein